MKKISIRNIIITLLCITIICMAIGFSFLSTQIDTLKNRDISFNVVIDEAREATSVKGGVTSPKCNYIINDDGHTLDMDFTLYSELDELAYNIIIENKGTIKAKIIDIISSPDYANVKLLAESIKPVSITKTDISGKILAPGETTTIKVVARYNSSTVKGTKEVPYKLSLITQSVE